MRLNCTDGKWGRVSEILLDGDRISHVLEADDDEGYVKIMKRDDDGDFVYPLGLEHTETVRGEVTISLLPLDIASPRGSKRPGSKLTECDIKVIRQRRSKGEYCKDIAADYPVSMDTISKICRRAAWAHVN